MMSFEEDLIGSREKVEHNNRVRHILRLRNLVMSELEIFNRRNRIMSYGNLKTLTPKASSRKIMKIKREDKSYTHLKKRSVFKTKISSTIEKSQKMVPEEKVYTTPTQRKIVRKFNNNVYAQAYSVCL